jgi:ferric-dicitrate binding protein FerR (iron transport regulator)
MWRHTSPSLALFALLTFFSAPRTLADTHSHARVVSLSFVQGTVITRSSGSAKWSRATLNMPIQEGLSLATARHSFAEVQFENGSTIRLGELSRLDFVRLEPALRGGSVNHLNLALGFATMIVIPKRHDDYVLTVSGALLSPRGKAEFRADLIHERLRVEVFSGRVQVAAATQSEQLRKNQALACDFTTRAVFQVSNAIQLDDWDKWVQARDRQAALAAYGAPGPGMYGWEDDLIPFGGMGALPGIFSSDTF